MGLHIFRVRFRPAHIESRAMDVLSLRVEKNSPRNMGAPIISSGGLLGGGGGWESGTVIGILEGGRRIIIYTGGYSLVFPISFFGRVSVVPTT